MFVMDKRSPSIQPGAESSEKDEDIDDLKASSIPPDPPNENDIRTLDALIIELEYLKAAQIISISKLKEVHLISTVILD
jgi:hypothetical protein